MDEGDVTEVFKDPREEQLDEYETDSDDEELDFEKHSELVKEHVLPDPAELYVFVHLCVSTCDGKR